MTTTLLIIAVLLAVKHTIADFFVQVPFMYLNKGTYGHPGGILHALVHGAMTFFVFMFFTPHATMLAVIDTVAHYHIDFAKNNVVKYYNWGPTTHSQYWMAVGVDQLLHMLTYIGLLVLAF